MRYFSTKKETPATSFRPAVIQGLAPDGGLYVPESIPVMETEIIDNLEALDPVEIGFAMMHPYTEGDLSDSDLEEILGETLSFDIPVVEVDHPIHTLELFHGPTLAFKDVGARFMSRCLGKFGESGDEVVVLVATSGDTGSAVANGFLGVPGVRVVVLYPKGKVSDLQEKQFASLGQNITALAIDGVFDDCQALVKQAFVDQELRRRIKLSSANSINLARWLPQSIYFALMVRKVRQQFGREKKIVVSVPSGNFGNLTAGVLAWKMGLPIDHFVAATNANDVVPSYLITGLYEPRASVETVANAMDVGAPSNFSRLQYLFDHDYAALIQKTSGYSYSDDQIKTCMREVHDRTGYTLDPHGATGYLSLKEKQFETNSIGVFLETAHPAKFGNTVSESIRSEPHIPNRLQQFAEREVVAIDMDNDFQQFRSFLLENYI